MCSGIKRDTLLNPFKSTIIGAVKIKDYRVQAQGERL